MFRADWRNGALPAALCRNWVRLAAYVHTKGLKFGLYSARCGHTCQGRPGSEGHEWEDAETFAGWVSGRARIGSF